MAISPRVPFDRSAPELTEWLITPGEPGWDTARRAWNLAVDQRPAAVALPDSADEVIAAVVLARDHGRAAARRRAPATARTRVTLPDAAQDHRPTRAKRRSHG